jgi:hypothetical protein
MQIEFNINRSIIEGISILILGVKNMPSFLPPHFLGLICGWPGSGKHMQFN